MNEINITKKKAMEIIKEYYIEDYDNMINIKVEDDSKQKDLVMKVTKQSKLRGKNIVNTDIIYEGQISEYIKKYMEKHNCFVDNIIFDPYFHNLNIRYHGEEFEIRKNNKGYEKVLVG